MRGGGRASHIDQGPRCRFSARVLERPGATEIRIYSPDTDVFVLALRRYPELCPNTVFVTGKGQNHRVIKLQNVVNALGPWKTAALPAFHALSGADNTGSFSSKGKASCWKAFIGARADEIRALSEIGKGDLPSCETMAAIERLVYQFFLPQTEISTVKELRWWLFRKRQAQLERLPPTQAALRQAKLRVHYLLLVWNNDNVANPVLPSPQGYGWDWKAEDKVWIPVMTTLPPAPGAIIHLVKCKCASSCTPLRCQCRKAGLKCTDLCGCCDSGEDCQNMLEDNCSENYSDSDGSYESDDE